MSTQKRRQVWQHTALWSFIWTISILITTGQSPYLAHDSLWFSVSTADHSTILLASGNGYVLKGKDGTTTEYVSIPGLGRHFADNHFLKVLQKGVQLKTVSDMGGAVWRLNDGLLEQIDRNQITRMHINAQYFEYRDTVFSHGGYGFWSARSQITFFDPTTGEWDVLTPGQNSESPPGIFNHMIFHTGDTLFVYAGNTVDAFDPVQHHLQENLWMFRISTKRWTNLGKINSNLHFNLGGQLSFTYNKMQFVYPVNKMVALINFDLNEISFYYPSARMTELLQKRHPFSTYHNQSDTLVWWEMTDSKALHDLPHRSEMVSIPVADLFDQKVDTEPLVINTTSDWWWLLLPAAALSGLFVLRRNFNRKDLISLSADGYMYRGQFHPAKSESLTLVKLLLDASGPVENAAVMNIVSMPNLHLSHNTRVKNQLVENTNIQLKTILGTSGDVILCNRLESDKRVRMYEIRKEVFRQ